MESHTVRTDFLEIFFLAFLFYFIFPLLHTYKQDPGGGRNQQTHPYSSSTYFLYPHTPPLSSPFFPGPLSYFSPSLVSRLSFTPTTPLAVYLTEYLQYQYVRAGVCLYSAAESVSLLCFRLGV